MPVLKFQSNVMKQYIHHHVNISCYFLRGKFSQDTCLKSIQVKRSKENKETIQIRGSNRNP